jgi:hypothetical protein
MKTFLLLLLVIALFACKNEKIIQDNYITLAYKQTQCADAWATGATDSITVLNVSNYLNAQNVYIASLNIKQVNTPDLCNACICKTGKIIYVTTFDNDALKQKYQALGFQ